MRSDELLRRERHRPAAEGDRGGHRRAAVARLPCRWRARLPTTGCYWRPALSRCGFRSRAPTSRTCSRCGRWPIAAPSSLGPGPLSARSSWAPASSGLKSQPPCGRAGSRSTWWRRRSGRWNGCLGAQMGDLVHALHVEHGVAFHLGDMADAIDGRRVVLKSGGVIEADLVVAGVGVRPRIALAEKAGLALDRGVVVNGYLETNAPGVFAAGDIARWPDPQSGSSIGSSIGWWPSVRGRRRAKHVGADQRVTVVPFLPRQLKTQTTRVSGKPFKASLFDHRPCGLSVAMQPKLVSRWGCGLLDH